jgi:hypothetical protein
MAFIPLGILAASGVVAASTYESIATVTVGSGGQASASFTSISSDYKHLQIRGLLRSTAVQNYFGIRMRVGNGSIDSGSNYSTHQLYGDGTSAAAAENAPSDTTFMGTGLAANDLSSAFSVIVIDLLEYANTNIYKTFRVLNGADKNGGGYVHLNSGSWRNTAAINQISVYPSGGNLAEYSSIALYGIKG